MTTTNPTNLTFDEQHEMDFMSGKYNGTDANIAEEKDIYDAFNF